MNKPERQKKNNKIFAFIFSPFKVLYYMLLRKQFKKASMGLLIGSSHSSSFKMKRILPF